MKDKQLVSKPQVEQIEEAPYLYLCWNFKRNEENGKLKLDSLKLSDDSVLTEQSIIEALKRATVAQNLSSTTGGSVEKKRKLNPMDHCGAMHS